MLAQFLITIILIALFIYGGKKLIYDPMMKKNRKKISEMNEPTEDEEYLLTKKAELEKTREALDIRKEEVSVTDELIGIEEELKQVNDKLLKAEQRRNSS